MQMTIPKLRLAGIAACALAAMPLVLPFEQGQK